MMFIYGRIVIPVHSLSSKSLNSKVFTHSDFKMPLSFVKIGSIAAIELQFINKILSLNVKILINFCLVWNTIRRFEATKN